MLKKRTAAQSAHVTCMTAARPSPERKRNGIPNKVSPYLSGLVSPLTVPLDDTLDANGMYGDVRVQEIQESGDDTPISLNKTQLPNCANSLEQAGVKWLTPTRTNEMRLRCNTPA